jgi:hypothetical protein
MANFVTQAELDEAAALSERWESLNADELQRLSYLCQLTQRHAANVTELFGISDHDGIISGMQQVIEKIQGRLA